MLSKKERSAIIEELKVVGYVTKNPMDMRMFCENLRRRYGVFITIQDLQQFLEKSPKVNSDNGVYALKEVKL